MRVLMAIWVGMALCASTCRATVVELYVAPGGCDTNPGTKGKPFQTLEAVRDAARAIEGPVTIILSEGTYVRTKSFELDDRDSAKTFVAEPGGRVRITGGCQVPASWFKPVTDAEIRGRLPESSRDKVLQADLGSLGIKKFSALKYSGHLLPWVTAHSELFFNGERMQLAQYPNGKPTRTGKAVNPGTRIRSYSATFWTNDLDEIRKIVGKPLELPVFNADPLRPRLERWKNADDIWCNLWANEYADMNLRISKIDYANNNVHLAQPVNYGLNDNRLVTFFNLLEEIDRPGEWYLDRKARILYFYPPSEITEDSIELSFLEEPVIIISGASNLTLEGIAVESTCGHGVQMIAGEGNRITRCSIKNVGLYGVFMGRFSKAFYGPYYPLGTMFDYPYGISDGGKNHLVEQCEVSHTGYGGIFVASGDRLTLEPGNIVVRNNYIHHIQAIKKTFEAGVYLMGVGNKALHNEISQVPHSGIFFMGNDHVMEYNEIHHACLEARDAGAIYTGRDVSFLGNTIRYNYIHDVHNSSGVSENVFGIYLDDKASGTIITDNLFVRTGNAGLKLSGGYMNTIENNVFVDIPAIFIFCDYGKKAFIDFVSSTTDSHGLKHKLEQVNYDIPPYSVKYPGIAEVQTKGLPENSVRNNFLLYRNQHLGHAPWLPKPKDGINGGWVTGWLVYKNGRFSGEVIDRPDLFPDNLIVNTALDEYKSFDPGFVNEAGGDYQFAPDSDVLKMMPGFRPLPIDEMGRLGK